ncbi:MAG: cysteine--tRNA ligase [Candidatus Micrarchaeia archaeon]
MQLYNSLTKKMEKFEPLNGMRVNLYVCGLTPYDHTHMGHARTYAAFDMLRRYLALKGYEVFHIQNVTDVDDKILKRAKESKQDPRKLAGEFSAEASELFKKLNILEASAYPKVTGHIPEIIALVKKLVESGHAYETETGVYFEVKKFPEYGKLSGQKLDEILAGSRKAVDETKKNPEDFALWKKTSGDAIEFDSPWGRGRPGWHIECSAMAGVYAKTLDIHGGARDLIFPHHENEIAQSEAAGAKPFVRFWLHTGFLTVSGEKMSKSLGNFVTLKDVLAQHSPNAVRMFFAMAHYRSPIDYNPEQIRQAEATVGSIMNTLDSIDRALEERGKKKIKDIPLSNELKKKFLNFYHFVDLDFDIPTGITYVFSLMKSVNAHLSGDSLDYEALEYTKLEMGKVLEILGLVREKKQIPDKTCELLDLLVELRDSARKKKDFKASDRIRDRLRQLGFVLEDGDDGRTRWKSL